MSSKLITELLEDINADTSKIEHDLAIDIRHWEDALKDCMNHLSK